jgi:hypothetical protein
MAGLDPAIQGRFAMAMPHWVYMLASQRNGTLYVGVTRDLPKRMYEHREGLTGGFTKQHKVIAWSSPNLTTAPWRQFSARRTSSTGRGNGSSR